MEIRELDREGRYCLPRRPAAAHKGDFGRLFLLAGSEGYTGAPVLAARGALRTGAGLVFLGVPRDVWPIVAVKCDEAMPFPLPERYEDILEKARSCDAALIGPGLGRHPRTERLVRSLLADLDRPVVLDADGINALAGHIHILDGRSTPTVLTPHEGEFARLTGCELPIGDRDGGGPELCPGPQVHPGPQGARHRHRRPGRAALAQRHRRPRHGQGGLRGRAGGDDRRPVGAEAPERPGLGPVGAGRPGGVVPRSRRRPVRPRLGEYAMLPGDLVETIPEILKENTL